MARSKKPRRKKGRPPRLKCAACGDPPKIIYRGHRLCASCSWLSNHRLRDAIEELKRLNAA